MEAHPDHARVAATVRAHGDALLRVAQRYSLCADDAHDAVQRGLEIYLRRLDRVDPATEVAWLKVVVKHEAMALRRARGHSVAGEDPELALEIADDARSPQERAESAERAGAPRRPCARSSTTRPSPSCSRPRATPTRRSAPACDGPTPTSCAR